MLTGVGDSDDHHIEPLILLVLLVANFANSKGCKKGGKMTETLVHGYSSESTHRELSNEYQHDRV